MFRKSLFPVFGVVCFVFVWADMSHAFRLLTKEEALAKIFGKGTEVVSEKHVLSGGKLDAVLKRLDGKLVYYQEGSESAKVASQRNVEFHFGLKNGKKIGAATIDVQPGKWGPVEFIVAMDLKAKVKAVYVMSYQEKRGRPIARKSFMRQYKNKSSGDALEVGKDITGISGATISSRCATYTVKKALVVYEELYLK